METTERNPHNVVFQALDALPSQLWYLLGIGAIVLSAVLQIAGKKNYADFVGKWPPTFFAIGIYHKLVRPGQDDPAGAMDRAVDHAQDVIA